MTNSPPSGSDVRVPAETAGSSAFDLFDRRIQQWIWKQGWTELRDIQEKAAAPILAGRTDVVIASATASGKTEAAFLPICSRIVNAAGGLQVLCISPLKALINDQYDRMRDLCEPIGVPVHRWHGDVAASQKRRVLNEPSGILLITPESLEALFIIHGPRMNRFFSDLRYIVVDELHAFIGTERGMQLQSLLHRVELAARQRIPRIALSATLGDMDMACDYLRRGQKSQVHIIESTTNRQEIRLQLRGYRVDKPKSDAKEPSVDEEVTEQNLASDSDNVAVATDLYRRLRGSRHLVFANSRRAVEEYTDLLRRFSDRNRVPIEFWPHHGSLSKEIRDDAESALKDGTKPATIIATTTLELGIDVGSVESIAQIGPPSSVASLRQRLGRSGRKQGAASVLRMYIQEEAVTDKTPPQDALRADLVQSIAMIRLLIQKWNEPPEQGALHLSTLVQQVLSLIAQHGGAQAEQVWRVLCESGPFAAVDQRMFAKFLRSLAAHDLVMQTHDGTIVLGLTGERLVNHYDFFTAFTNPEEYRLVAGSSTLGTLPIVTPIVPDMFLIFSGRRWMVIDVDDKRKIINVKPSAGGKAPQFSGSGGLVHNRIRQEMFHVYRDVDQPPFSNATAQDLLTEGRDWFRRYELDQKPLLRSQHDTLMLPWAGDRIMNTLLVQLLMRGLKPASEGIALLVREIKPNALVSHLEAMAASLSDPHELAEVVRNKQTQKHHLFLSEDLLSSDYASSHLDTVGALDCLKRVLAAIENNPKHQFDA